MIGWIILGVSIILIITFIFSIFYVDEEKISNKFCIAIMLCGILGVVGFFTSIIIDYNESSALQWMEQQEEQITSSTSIIALSGSTSFEGGGSLLYVSMETKSEYAVLCDNGKGGYIKKMFPVADTNIYFVEDNFRVEEVEIIITKTKDNSKRKYFKNKQEDRKTKTVTEYNVYVPKDSIVNTFEVN